MSLRRFPIELKDLAKASGVTERTIKFYVSNGLMDGPETQGRSARYGDEHLERLRLIKRLSEEGLKLSGIKQRLAEENSASAYVRKALRALNLPETFEIGEAATVPEEAQEIGEAWRRVPLLDGLEIHYLDPAPPEIQAHIRQIQSYFASLHKTGR